MKKEKGILPADGSVPSLILSIKYIVVMLLSD